MELNEALAKLAQPQRKLYACQAASSALYLDGATVAPKDTAEGRGAPLGVLAGEKSDFRLFRPVPEKLVAFNIKFTGHCDSSNAPCGGLPEPADVVKNACGDFDPAVFADCLEKKYSQLYGL